MRDARGEVWYYGRFTNHDEIMNSVDVVLKDPQNWIMVEVFWTYKVDSEPGLLTMHFFNTSDSKTGWMKDINFLSLNKSAHYKNFRIRNKILRFSFHPCN